jgi:peptidoglycan/LPS O-acetylase OafA/YrhL
MNIDPRTTAQISAVTSQPVTLESRLGAIDALRGIAALCVVVYHARSTLWTGVGNLFSTYGLSANPQVWIGYATYPLSYGWLGVTLFFVLSGYCIHRRGAAVLRKGNGVAGLNWGQFFKRRLWRIYPTYIAALILGGLIDFYLLRESTLVEPKEASYSVASFLASVFAMQGYSAPFFGTNMVFWTLAMELHLYAAYPILTSQNTMAVTKHCF